MSPEKVRRTLRLIQGMPLKEAQAMLALLPHRSAQAVRRALASAAANAENNHGMEKDELWVKQASVDAGPTLKRWRPASAGRIGAIKKRISHISVVLSDGER
jgi:large subunit ribosomal protein L22